MNMRKTRFYIAAIALLAACSMLAPGSASAKTTRIKDIVQIEGVRDNMLVGYGLVVGLNKSGDSLNNSPFTQQSMVAMLERLGVNTRGQKLNTGNTWHSASSTRAKFAPPMKPAEFVADIRLMVAKRPCTTK